MKNTNMRPKGGISYAHLNNDRPSGDDVSKLDWALDPNRKQALVLVPEKTLKNTTLFRRATIALAATTGVLTLATAGAAVWGQHEATLAATADVSIHSLTQQLKDKSASLSSETTRANDLTTQLQTANKTIQTQAQEQGELQGENKFAVPIAQSVIKPKPMCTRPVEVNTGAWVTFGSWGSIGGTSHTVNQVAPC